MELIRTWPDVLTGLDLVVRLDSPTERAGGSKSKRSID